MSKGLEALERIQCNYVYVFKARENGKTQLVHDLNTVKKELKALDIISQNFRLVGNCLHARNPYAEDGWVFVKEIENEEELKAWQEVLL